MDNIESGGTPQTTERGAGAHPGPRLTPEAFVEELRSARRAVWTIAIAILQDRAAADDTVQEAAAIALTKLNEFDVTTSFAAWFGQIVRYTALNEGRRRKRARPASDGRLDAAVSRSAISSETAFDVRVQAAVDSLDETARTCLLMRTIHGMSFSEISRALSIPEGTAMSHVHRARAVLRERLAPNDGRLSP